MAEKKSKKNKPSRTRYKNEGRKMINKKKKIAKQIKKYERIKQKNPDAKVDKGIRDLKNRLKEI